MRHLILLLTLPMLVSTAMAQTTADLFTNPETRVSWLGVDYSHVKLIGEFDQFAWWGEKSHAELKNDYFPAWNKVVVNEREKYDFADMLNRKEVYYDIEMIMKHNSLAKPDELEAYNEPNYTADDIVKFVKDLKIRDKEGIGVLFIAEAYNKATAKAIHHVVFINMKTGQVLLQERFTTEPGGFGLRNFWANSIYKVIEEIDDHRYKEWQKEYMDTRK